MASKQTATDSKELSTDVYHDGREVAVRARSQHSQSAHIPKTDDAGNVVFVEGTPEPECGVEPNSNTEWVLRSIGNVANRDKCSRCFNADDVADQNAKNGASVSFARKIRFGDDWGEDGGEDSSVNASHTSGY